MAWVLIQDGVRVAVTLDGFVSPIAVWERPERAPAEWKVPRSEVDDAIADAMERFEVAELAVDPPGWAAEIDGWRELYGDVVVEFPTNQRGRMAPACDRFLTGVLEGGLTHDGSAVLARHVGHCIAKDTPYGRIVTKDHPDSPRKIDAGASGANSRLALAVRGIAGVITPAPPFATRVVAVTLLPPFFNFGTKDELAHPRRQAALFI